MSNLDLTREFWRVWNEEGLSGLVSRYDDLFTDDYEWRPPVSQVTGVCYVGREGFERYVADVEEALRRVRGELEEVVEIAPDAVRSRARMHGEGAGSGVVIDTTVIGIARFRDGRMCWGWGSYDLAAADRLADAIARGEEVSV
jgi:ketosteroid isomerase-like protein